MKVNSLLLFGIAIGCGLVAMLGLKQYMNRNQKQEVETVDILVATADIAAGGRLDETNTSFMTFPKDSAPAEAVTSREQINEMTYRTALVAGETIMIAKLSDEVGAAAEIPPGYRLLTVPVNATTSHSGLLLPGNRVDIMVTFKRRTRDGMVPDTKTVLRYIEVFATDKIRDTSSTDIQDVNSKNVSLLVTDEQAPTLLKAMNKGELQLAMRSKADNGSGDEPLDTGWLDGEEEQKPEPVQVADVPEAYTPTEVTEPVEDDSAKTLRDLLIAELNGSDDEEEEEVVEEEVLANVDPERPTWEIVIFSGQKKRTEVVQIPDEEWEAQLEAMRADEEAKEAEEEATRLEEAADAAREAAKAAPTTEKVFKGLINLYFGA